jgi:hypothetical protein
MKATNPARSNRLRLTVEPEADCEVPKRIVSLTVILVRLVLVVTPGKLRSLFRFSIFSPVWALALFPFLAISSLSAAEAPRLVQKDGRYALLVDGRAYLILGGQIHNSSAWPSELPQVWESLAALHANTIEAPLYWEQFEPEPGKFDFTNVDVLLREARAHNFYVILLWFGTWKNGNMHYVPAWVKNDTTRFPRVIDQDGEPIDVLSPLSRNTLEADKSAFAALARHLNEVDNPQHTVLLLQVENEPGIMGSVRDFSPEANKEFAGPVPPNVLAATHRQRGTWREVFGSEADEIYNAYRLAIYINEIAAAGKREFNIPYYVNVWVKDPATGTPQRQLDHPGFGYPSGGAVQKKVLIDLWRGLTPSVDMIGPDIYFDDLSYYRDTLQAYSRPDNPLWVPETGRSDGFGKFLFYALGMGAIGFAPFGVDQSGWNITGEEAWTAHPRNFAILAPLAHEIAQLAFDGQLRTAVEEPGDTKQELDFGAWQATVEFGLPRADGRLAPGTKDTHGAAIVAKLGPDEFLVTGLDATVLFHLPGKKPWKRSQIVTAEQGKYEKGVWKRIRLWNGDETDYGLWFHQKPEAVRVKMQRF